MNMASVDMMYVILMPVLISMKNIRNIFFFDVIDGFAPNAANMIMHVPKDTIHVEMMKELTLLRFTYSGYFIFKITARSRSKFMQMRVNAPND